jgi:hypothetical protein
MGAVISLPTASGEAASTSLPAFRPRSSSSGDAAGVGRTPTMLLTPPKTAARHGSAFRPAHVVDETALRAKLDRSLLPMFFCIAVRKRRKERGGHSDGIRARARTQLLPH